MLALTRKKGESIIIGDDIEVIVLGVQGEQVRLGVRAPRSVSVHRREIYEQIMLANKASAESADLDSVKNLFKD